MLAFRKAGRAEPPDEERRAQLMKLLPSGTSMASMTRAAEQLTPDDFIDLRGRKRHLCPGARRQGRRRPPQRGPDSSTGLDLHRHRRRPVGLLQRQRLAPTRGYNELCEDDVASMNSSELLVFVRTGGGFKGGKGWTGKVKAKAAGKEELAKTCRPVTGRTSGA